MFGSTVSMEMAAKANALRWFGQVLRTQEDKPVRIVLNFEVRGKRKKRPPKSTRKRKVRDSLQKSCLKLENASN